MRSNSSSLGLSSVVLALAAVPSAALAQDPGEKGGPGLALTFAKALVCSWEGEKVVDNAVILIKDGKIQSVEPRESASIPVDYRERDFGPLWAMPGMIDLHSHVGGSFDINDMVYVTNPELRVHCSVIADNPNFRRAIAGAVTSVLFIPGSGTNSGGQGVLVKTGLDRYEPAIIRDPGSLKVAQWGNPERWAIGVGKTFENWHLRKMFEQGRSYAKRWEEFEAGGSGSGGGEKPERDLRLDVFRDLFGKKTQVSVHTQVAQVVMMTIVMIRGEFGLDVYIDHGEFGGYLYAGLAKAMGVPAILGPRNVDAPARLYIDWVGNSPERMQGLAAGYQERGMDMIGFNTDSNVIPQEELFLQSAINVRYGFDNSSMAAVLGHTIVPAKTAGIDSRLGSLEPGKDADIVVISGDPSDPRSSVEVVFIEGKSVYDTGLEARRF
jgi:imidazolonepropionase-like amidohydrolase